MVERSRTPVLTAELAQEIASETGSVVGFQVLITDRDGTVIGAGDPLRVGSVHEASKEVLRTQAPAWHTAEQAKRLKGVRPGITLPLVIDGTAIGTVAIAGSPRRVRQFGLVVRRQTEILLEQAVIIKSRMLREHAMQDLLRDIVFFDPEVMEPEALELRAAELGFDPDIRRAVLLAKFDPISEASAELGPVRPLRIVREVFDAVQDVTVELTSGRIVILHSMPQDRTRSDAIDLLTQRAETLCENLENQAALTAQVGISAVTSGFRGLHDSYQDAATALRIGPRTGSGAVFPIEEMRLQQLLTSEGHYPRRRFREITLGRLPAQRDWHTLRATLMAWVEGGFNLIRASELLHIHRNTLLYRLDKITRLAGRPVRNPSDAISLYLACLTDQIDSVREE
ncbi:hypothetical protein G4Z16_17930 [Streptomyces bathyalis]|uniref:Sugar diacid utilization regulator n=1 Tax=Streptomyces bathyalis TaxID=2710756 RepID=A0A7T1T7T7_9ACTN|nr:sugar diacid recognition domain-containing protein [Streptomyces bathyalis]QPP07971.1 hypothetical protein G4Z16_17930 [Streptomyces bathyalis]